MQGANAKPAREGTFPVPKEFIIKCKDTLGWLHHHAHVQVEKLYMGVIHLLKIMLEIVAKLHTGDKCTKLQLVPYSWGGSMYSVIPHHKKFSVSLPLPNTHRINFHL